MHIAAALSRPAIDNAVARERLAIADRAETFTDDEWDTPSLCAGWTVRDVVAHLTTTTRDTLGQILRAAIRARFDFDRMTMDQALALSSTYSTGELVGRLRESAASTRRMPLSGPLDPLMDLVVHAQDIARPLGFEYTSSPNVLQACLAHLATNRFMGGPARLRGVRLVCTDTRADDRTGTPAWTLGNGAELHGPAVDLLLVTAGRRSGLDALTGPGVDVIAPRLS